MTQALPPEDPHHPREEINLTPEEEALARKIDIVKDLRALVEHPGWLYLSYVLREKAANVRFNLKEATTMDGLFYNNSELREATTYEYVLTIPEDTIVEFQAQIEAIHDDE